MVEGERMTGRKRGSREGGRSQHGEVSGVERGEGFRRVVLGTEACTRYAGGRVGE